MVSDTGELVNLFFKEELYSKEKKNYGELDLQRYKTNFI